MIRFLTAVLFICCSLAASAQVQQSGTITNGHAVRWVADGIIANAGTAAEPFTTSLGASPGPICVNSGPVTAAYNAFCMISTSTGATLSVNNIGGATGGLTFEINGVLQSIPTVVLPTIAGRTACFTNTAGSLENCAAGSGVTSLGGASGTMTLGSGLTVVGQVLSNSGVLSFGGSTGAITVSTGLTFAGNALSNSGVTSFGGQTGAITVSTGLQLSGSALSNTGVTSFGGSTGAITVSTGLNLTAGTLTNTGVTSLGSLTGAFTCTASTGVICTSNAVKLDLTTYIPALTLLAAPDANLDFVVVYDHTGIATKKATVGSIASSATSGVASLGGQTGALTCGTGITCAASTVTNTGVTSVGGSTGAITVSTGLNLTAGTLTNTGVLSLAGLTGAFTCTASTGVICTSNAVKLDLTTYIPALTLLASPDANLDFVIVYDHTGVATKKATVGSIATSATSGVSSLGSQTGALTCGTGITCAASNVSVNLTTAIGALSTKNTPTTADYVVIYDVAGSAAKASLISTLPIVRTFGGSTGAITVSTGLNLSANALTNTGVTSFGGSTGAITVSTGLTLSANALSNTGVTSFGGSTGAITVSTGLNLSANALTNTGVLTVGGSAGAITCSSGIACSGGAITNDFVTYIPALTAKTTPSAVNDYMILYDAAAVAVKKVNSASLGIDACTGVRTAKTTTYTVAATDNHTLLSLGGTAFYTVALPAASGLLANFSVCLHNADTGRGKFITVDSGTNFFLWPGQTAVAYNDNSTWSLRKNNRWRLPGGVFNLYADYALGADTNDCLATGAGACKTVEQALYLACDQFDLNGTTVPTKLTVNMANSNVDLQGVHYSCRVQTGAAGGEAIIINGGTGSSIAPVSGNAVAVYLPGNVLELTGDITLSSGAGDAAAAGLGGKLYISGTGIKFGTTTGSHISSTNAGSEVFVNTTSYVINGSAAAHVLAQAGGLVTAINTLPGTVVWGTNGSFTWFTIAANGGIISLPNWTYNCNTFACNGQRYNVQNLSMIYTGTAGSATYFPGNVAGASSAGTAGIYQ